ncbi:MULTISPECIES: hypothetical protein [Phaeobacter]|uniref:hypothetical protein n=1 Tax=Phaeobacter TaxID=302485 RepID=UPI00058B09FB|nr:MULTISPECIES: hypothetical protein [Phaeobacter]UTS80075.1 hypothetical protein OL67_001132 [Phaeobacter piscinae]UWR56766.1 hypothetical protein K4F89_17385 [Phaeobacter inhibens]UWR61796.1 hypothetical protein K4F88_05465 [Phaeobacter inhibens]
MANRDNGKTPANVAGHATQKDALRRNRLSLLGLFGASNNLSAMVRMPSGRTQVVTRGSRLSGGEVIAIDADGLILQKNGKAARIEMPGS